MKPLIIRFIVLLLLFSGQLMAETPSRLFNHSDTGFDLDGMHGALSCDSCHVDGNFAGTPRECVLCHSFNGFVNATPKSVHHIESLDDCESCHATTFWSEIDRVDHSLVIGTCRSCHDSITATGLPSNHIETAAECDSCHSTIAWEPTFFDHDGVTGECQSCHNGINATGKPSDHITTASDCSSCHSTRNWDFSHSRIMDECQSCHSLPSKHDPVTEDCGSCHSTDSWDAD